MADDDENAAETPADDAAAKPEPAPKAPPAGRAVARAGGGALAAEGAGGHAVVIAPPAQPGMQMPRIKRRTVILTSFWAGMIGLLAAIGLTILKSIYPPAISRLSGQFVIGNVNSLQPGDKKEVVVQVPDKKNPLASLDAKIYLVRLNKEQADRNPGAEEGMVYAFWRRCPHLGCTVPYSATFSFEDPRSNQTYPGWFRCPCHGSTYSDSGVKVFGPAPRSLDSFPVVIDPNGDIKVDVGVITVGAPPLSDAESKLGVLPPS